MTGSSERRPVWPTRLLQRLIAGTGAEFLRGDLEEVWAAACRSTESSWTLQVRHLGNVLKSLVRWWSPRSIRQRGRDGRDANYDVHGTWRGEVAGGMGNVLNELKVTLRGLARRPGFTLVTVLTLALGIGATTTILSVVDAVVLRPLPYEDADQLVGVGVTFPGREWVEGVEGVQHLAGVSYPNFRYVQQRSRTLAALAGVQRRSSLLPDLGDGPELVGLMGVSEDFFEIMGARAEIGRLFTPDEYASGGAESTIVLSYASWRDRFGSDPDVVGRPIPSPLEAAPVIIGVLNADFVPPESIPAEGSEFWQPLDTRRGRLDSPGDRSLTLIGRLAPGVDIEAARAEATQLAAEIVELQPEGSVYPDGTHFGYGVNNLHAQIVGSTSRTLLIFMGAAALLLAIAAMNAANLMLVRGVDRRGELGVRRALGAGRVALVRQLVLESLTLAALGGALGVLFAFAGVGAFLNLSPDLPRMDEVVVDGRILLMTAIISIGAGMLTGLAPAFGMGRRDLATGIRETAASGSAGLGAFRNAMVAGQLALALILGIGASVLMHSFIRVRSVDPGFNPQGVSTFTLTTKRPGGPVDSWGAWDQTLATTRSIAGLSGVAGVSNLPFEDPNWSPGFLFPGDAPEDVRTGIAGYLITPEYFSVMEQELLSGRAFDGSDGPEGESVAIINRALEDLYFRDQEALGSTILMGEEETPTRIVGVVETAIVRRAEEGVQPALYMPYTQASWPWVRVVVRSAREEVGLAAELRQAAAEISPVVPIQSAGPLHSRISAAETTPRFQALLIGTFALAALLLSAIGLYGSLAHAVGSRTREIGIRMAMGAEPEKVFRLILRQGFLVAGVGGGIGLLGAFWMTRMLERFLFDVPALDPIAFGAGSVGLGLAAALAVLRPALRAAGVDIVKSLKAD